MLLRSCRGLRPNEEDDFSIFSSDSLRDAWEQLTRVLAATAIAVVLLSGSFVLLLTVNLLQWWSRRRHAA